MKVPVLNIKGKTTGREIELSKNIFGTKMRSVIKTANSEGINAVVDQQFSIAKQILSTGLMPIIEPEVD